MEGNCTKKTKINLAARLAAGLGDTTAADTIAGKPEVIAGAKEKSESAKARNGKCG